MVSTTWPHHTTPLPLCLAAGADDDAGQLQVQVHVARDQQHRRAARDARHAEGVRGHGLYREDVHVVLLYISAGLLPHA